MEWRCHRKKMRLKTGYKDMIGSSAAWLLAYSVVRETGSLLYGHAPINHRVPEKARVEAIQTVRKWLRCGVVGVKMTTLVLDNGAYNAKIGYSHDNVS